MPLDAFLRLTTVDDQMVEGESTDVSYAKHIQLIDFSLCSGQEVDAALGDIGGDAHTQRRMQKWARDNAAKADRLKQQEDEARRKEEKKLEASLARANSGFVTGLQKVTTQIAQQSAQQKDKPASNFGKDFMGFQIKKDADSASADLFQAYCSTVIQPNPSPKLRKLGQFATAEVTLRKMFDGKPRPYLFCSFRDLLIDSYTVSFDSGRTHLIETVTFKFVSYRMKYQSQTEAGQAGRASDISGTMASKSE